MKWIQLDRRTMQKLLDNSTKFKLRKYSESRYEIIGEQDVKLKTTTRKRILIIS